MPRFYFDVRDGENFTRDNEGLDFDGIRQAQTEAARMLAEMMKEAMPDGSRCDMGVEVRDEAKRPLLKVQLTFAVEPLA
jgi:hypothetical protein